MKKLLKFAPMLVGGLNAGLAVAAIELMLQAPKKKLMKRGLLGFILAVGLSFFVPLLVKRIFSRGHAQKA